MKNIFFFCCITIFSITSLFAQDIALKNGRYFYKMTGKPYSGIYKEYNDDGRLVSEINISQGILDGISTYYYPAGTKKEVRVYSQGQKNGIWITWNQDGVKTAEAGFIDGRKEGSWTIWDDRGIKRYEMFYVNGEKTGTWIIYDGNGKETSREEFK